jgi:hypothetical protein
VDCIFSNDLTSPIVAYITFDTIESRRSKFVLGRQSRNTANAPVQNIRRKKLSSIQPKNCVKDPYIAAILIALGQEKRWQQQWQGQNKEGTTTDRLNQSNILSSKTAPPSSPDEDLGFRSQLDSVKVCHILYDNSCSILTLPQRSTLLLFPALNLLPVSIFTPLVSLLSS